MSGRPPEGGYRGRLPAETLVKTTACLLLSLALALPALAEGETTKTDSGLEITVLRAGEAGTNPQPGDVVTVHYVGTFPDGRTFDSSRAKGEPFVFTLGQGQVIRGWDEGVALMTVGSLVKLQVPWPLAYGESGRPPKIPAKADLVFEVELLSVKRVPRFCPADPEKQKTLPSGLKVEVLKEGQGEPARKDQGVRLRFAFWNAEGDLVLASESAQDARIAGAISGLRLGRFQLPFLAEAAGLMKPGSICRFEVPGALGFGDRQVDAKLPANATTIWQLELEAVNDVPKFQAPSPERQKTASGLGYEVVEAGSGASPAATDRVRVHYTGWLEDGTLFDSSHARGEPIVFPLNRVIAGWSEGVQLMKVGGTTRFTIPGDLAYGATPLPGSGIPPNATLVFLVQLLEIVK
jgi:FKBP-type peptidyl-prolyl cis-trans isomerase